MILNFPILEILMKDAIALHMNTPKNEQLNSKKIIKNIDEIYQGLINTYKSGYQNLVSSMSSDEILNVLKSSGVEIKGLAPEEPQYKSEIVEEHSDICNCLLCEESSVISEQEKILENREIHKIDTQIFDNPLSDDDLDIDLDEEDEE